MSWFKNLSFLMKVSLSFMLLLSLIVAFSGWVYLMSQGASERNALVLEESLPFALTAEPISQDVIEVQQWLTDRSATRGRADRAFIISIVACLSPSGSCSEEIIRSSNVSAAGNVDI